MSPIWLALGALAVAPILDRVLDKRPALGAFADGMVQIAVGGILLLHVLPAGIGAAGWPALAALVGGAIAADLAHRVPRGLGGLAVIALLTHAFLDGVALATGHGALAHAVILHTVPVGMATWRLADENLGPRWAALVLVATAGVTVAGATLGLPPVEETHLGIAQCAVGGTLVHTLGHLGRGSSRPAGWGALAGAGLVLLLGLLEPPELTQPGELGALQAGARLLAASAPAVVLGWLVAGLQHALSASPAPPTSLLAGLFGGLRQPVSSCGALRTWQEQLDEGANPRGAAAALVTAPQLGAGAILLSWALLGAEFTLARLGFSLVAGLAVGLVVSGRPGHAHGAPPEGRSWSERLGEGLEYGLKETVDHTAPWLIFAGGVAVLAEPLLQERALGGLSPVVAALALAALALPAHVCAWGAGPLLAILLHKGLPTGAALALAVAGPAASTSTLRALAQRHGRGAAGAAAAAVLVVALCAAAFGRLLPAPVERLHTAPSTWEQVAAGLAVLAAAAALVRNGPRTFIEPLLHPEAHVAGDAHDHHHHHH